MTPTVRFNPALRPYTAAKVRRFATTVRAYGKKVRENKLDIKSVPMYLDPETYERIRSIADTENLSLSAILRAFNRLGMQEYDRLLDIDRENGGVLLAAKPKTLAERTYEKRKARYDAENPVQPPEEP